jgi:hypothetical protein
MVISKRQAGGVEFGCVVPTLERFMSVSHYVISTLNLIGLGATALGLCYTTQKYFGRVTNKVLRAVLVALPPALMYIVCVSLGIYGQ